MSIVVNFEDTVAGVTNFSGQQINFTEVVNPNLMPSNVVVVITSYSYSALGAAHDALLQLSPSAASAGNLAIELENRTSMNTFAVACEYPVPQTSAGVALVVLFTTSGGKDNDGTLRIQYEIRAR